MLAVLPPVNLSRYENAPDVVMNKLVVEMLEARIFNVLDPGLVEDVILRKRVRLTDRLSLETLHQLGEALGVQYLMLGTINEFGVVQDGRSSQPTVSISLRIVTCANGQIVWAASHSKRGDDAESVFGIGRITTLDQLAGATVREMTRTLVP
jgi:curli biogenesis system outer membrane secretion channel CsgG